MNQFFYLPGHELEIPCNGIHQQLYRLYGQIASDIQNRYSHQEDQPKLIKETVLLCVPKNLYSRTRYNEMPMIIG